MLQPPGSSRPRTTTSSRRKTPDSPDDIIRQLQRLPPNKRCVDCGSKLPACVNLTIGSFVCMVCAGIHRELSARVKGVGHSSFTAEEAEMMKATDNDKVNALYMARYNPNSERLRQPQGNQNQQHLRSWIQRKYKDRAWYDPNASAGGGGPPQQTQPQPTVAQIPPKQPQPDLFGFDAPVAAPAPAPSNQWDAFGGPAPSQVQQQPAPQQQQQAPAPAPQPNFQANFADFGSPQQQQQQQQGGFANFDQAPAQQGGFANFDQSSSAPQPQGGFANFNQAPQATQQQGFANFNQMANNSSTPQPPGGAAQPQPTFQADFSQQQPSQPPQQPPQGFQANFPQQGGPSMTQPAPGQGFQANFPQQTGPSAAQGNQQLPQGQGFQANFPQQSGPLMMQMNQQQGQAFPTSFGQPMPMAGFANQQPGTPQPMQQQQQYPPPLSPQPIQQPNASQVPSPAITPQQPSGMATPTPSVTQSTDAVTEALSQVSMEEKPVKTTPVKGVSKYKAGQIVYYKSSSYVGSAKIVKVHFDDALDPFYTISVDGKEKQTDDGHLSEKSPVQVEIESILSTLTEEKQKMVLEFVSGIKNGTSMPQAAGATASSPAATPAPTPVPSFQTPEAQRSVTSVTGPPNVQTQTVQASPGWGGGIPSPNATSGPPQLGASLTMGSQAPPPPIASPQMQQPPQQQTHGSTLHLNPSQMQQPRMSHDGGMMAQGGPTQHQFQAPHETQGVAAPAQQQRTSQNEGMMAHGIQTQQQFQVPQQTPNAPGALQQQRMSQNDSTMMQPQFQIPQQPMGGQSEMQQPRMSQNESMIVNPSAGSSDGGSGFMGIPSPSAQTQHAAPHPEARSSISAPPLVNSSSQQMQPPHQMGQPPPQMMQPNIAAFQMGQPVSHMMMQPNMTQPQMNGTAQGQAPQSPKGNPFDLY